MMTTTNKTLLLTWMLLGLAAKADNPYWATCKGGCGSCGDLSASNGDVTKCEPDAETGGVTITVQSDISQADADKKCTTTLTNPTTASSGSPADNGVTASNYSPTGLSQDGSSSGQFKYETLNGVLSPRQFSSSKSTFDITLTPDGKGYKIAQYRTNQIGEPDAGGIRSIPQNVAPITSTTFRNPDGPTTTTAGKLDVIHCTIHPISGATVTRTVRLDYPVGALKWSRKYYLGDPETDNLIQPHRVVTLERTLNGDIETQVEITKDLSSGTDPTNLVTTSNVTTKYAFYKQGFPVPLVRTVHTVHTGTGADIVTTTTYNTDPALSFSFNKPATIRRNDGYWEDITYQGNETTGILITKTVTGWLDNPPGAEAGNRVITRTEALKETGMFGHVETIMGVIVSQSWGERQIDSFDQTVETTHVKQGDATLTTIRTGYSIGADNGASGRLKSIQHPDGTFELHSYELLGTNRIETVDSGVGTIAKVTDGTCTVSTYDAYDVLTKQVTSDIASGITLSSRQGIAFTSSGAPYKWAYDNDTRDYSETLYGCCGIDSERTRDGVETSYTHDALKRPKTMVSQGVTTTYTYGITEIDGTQFPSTQITQSAGNPALTLDQGTTVYDLAGNVIQQISPDLDGDGNPETTTITRNDAARTTTTLNPDGGTSISTSSADGQSTSLTGTAVADSGQTIAVGSNLDGITGAVMKTTTTRPSGTAAGNLVTATYTGIGGLTLASKLNDVTVQTVTYDEHARPVLLTDGDGVKQHTAYNPQGKAYRHATSRDGNNDINPGTDIVTDTVTDVTTIAGFGPAIRTISTIWTGAQTSIITSTTLRSPDGTKTSATTVGIANPATSLSATSLQRATGAGTWTDTATAPDGTRQNTTYQNWLPVTQARTGAGGSPVLESITTHYDSLRRPDTTTHSRTGLVTTYYAANGMVDHIDDHGRVTFLSYDNMGRRVNAKLKEGTKTWSSTHSTYTKTGQNEATWGDQTYPTFATYDEQGRLRELRTYRSTNLALAPTEDTGGDATTWVYYPNGRLEKKLDAATRGPLYTYTAAGRIKTRLWGRGILTTYGYTNGLLTTVTYDDGTPGVTYTYDSLGRRKSITNGLAASVFTYDDSSTTMPPHVATLALDTETITYSLPGQPPFTRVLDRTDRSLGRDTGWDLIRTDLLGTPPVATPIIENNATYTYSATTGQLASAGNPVMGTFTYGYSYTQTAADPEANPPVPAGARVGSTTGTKQDVIPYTLTKDGTPTLQTLRTYEANRDVLVSIQNKAGTTVRSMYDYSTVNGGVNNLGQRMGVQTTFNLGGSPALAANPSNISWDYDDLGQLTSAADSATSANGRAYQYDTIGNRLFAEKGAAQIPATQGVNTTGYTPDALNQYDALTPYNANGSAGAPVVPVHDFDGNMTHGPLPVSPTANCTLIWDAENRLMEVKNASNVTLVKYTYDALSRRIASTIGTDTTLYLYDGWNGIAEYTGTPPAIAKKYLWGLDLSGSLQGAGGVGGLLAVAHGATPYYPTYDGNGNVSEYLKANGEVAAHFEYDPFGNTVIQSEASTGLAATFTYRFSTKPLDFATGLYYYGYRWYAPLTGRWPSRDPIEEKGGVNLYGFVGNDGVNWLDYLGLEGTVINDGADALSYWRSGEGGTVEAGGGLITDLRYSIPFLRSKQETKEAIESNYSGPFCAGERFAELGR